MKILKNLNWVYEVVSEYANIEILNKESIIYGGIIRDILAKKNPKGDIDVAILPTNLISQTNSLSRNCKWKRVQKPVKALILEKEKYKPHLSSVEPKSNLDFIYEYKNNNKILQLIVTKDITRLICNVDFVCCGIGMDYNGNIIEYLDGAYDDCINNRLRLNVNHSRPDILVNRFKKRLTKLTKRGWEPCNISKDRKILYKNIYKKTYKNKKRDSKTVCTRENFIDKNLYKSKTSNTIIIHHDLFKYSKIDTKDVFEIITSKFGYTSMPIFDNKNCNVYVNYTKGRIQYIKKYFKFRLPRSIKGVYTEDNAENTNS